MTGLAENVRKPQKWKDWSDLTHWGLVMPFGDRDLGQHWLRQWLVTWRHQAITWTNIDLSSVRCSGIHLRAISSEIPQPPFTKVSLKITHLKLNQNLPGANELIVMRNPGLESLSRSCVIRIRIPRMKIRQSHYLHNWNSFTDCKETYVPWNIDTVLLIIALLWAIISSCGFPWCIYTYSSGF